MKNLWNEREARKFKSRHELLVYRSRLIGSEPKLCVWGGGNTSTKQIERDHCGRPVRVLRIKGSGSDLKVSTPRDYPPVSLDDLCNAYQKKSMTDEAMVDFVGRCLLDPKAPRPSIEVLLHAFVDHPDIDHTHADAILSLTNLRGGQQICKKIYGNELIWVPYVKPGFTLAKWVGEAYQKNRKAKGVILENHGLITWGPDSKTSYSLTIEMVTRAEKFLAKARKKRKYWSKPICKNLSSAKKKEWLFNSLPTIRKAISGNQKTILIVNDSPKVMEFVNAQATAKVSQVGPATPDHMLRTKRIPLYVRLPQGNPEKLTQASLSNQIEQYAKEHERYFKRNRRFVSPSPETMLDPYPKVILIPGVGMIATGKDLKSAQIVSEIYEHSIDVMVSSSCVGTYKSLSERLAFEMDYWSMELYKLSLAPPEAEFSRQIGLVTGAARGIGRSIAEKLAASGAHVFLSDLKTADVQQAADEINQSIKAKRAFAIGMDVTHEASVQRTVEKIVLMCGGIDFLVSNAGIAHVAPVDRLNQKDWDRSLAVNATGHFLVAKEVVRVLKRQELGGSIVFIASKNVLAPGKDFGAYSAAKAAETQLARILAIENGAEGIRVNTVNPDGVFKDSGLWEKIIPNRAKSYGISPNKLKKYYVDRNLMKTPIFPEDVADSVAFLLSSKAAKTTGCILTVDGGVKEAFPR